MHLGKNKFSNFLFRNMTPAEKVVFDVLVGLELKFHAQRNIGPFVVDFLIKNPRLIIEIDGSSHNGREAYDSRREAWLKKYFHAKIFRFSNEQVFEPEFRHNFSWKILRLLPSNDPRAKRRFRVRERRLPCTLKP